MTDVASHNLTGSRFEDVYLTDARFQRRRPHQGRLAPFDLTGVMICDAALLNVDLSGEIKNLLVNGVGVVPLVEAELTRRYRERVKMRPTDANGFREAWDILERLWQRSVVRASGMARSCSTNGTMGSGPSSRRCAISSSSRTSR